MDRRSFNIALVDRSLDIYGLNPHQFRVYLCLVLSPEIEWDEIAPRCLMEWVEVQECLEFLARHKLISLNRNIRLNPVEDWLPCAAPVPKPTDELDSKDHGR